MPNPVAAGSQLASFPAWVLLEPFASFGEWRNHTTATSLTSLNKRPPVEVSFELVDPPGVSRWFVRWVGPKKKQKRGFYGPPSIVNSSGSFVVMRMAFYRPEPDGRILDYFVYKAGPGTPSLDLIPGPCPTVNFPKLVGILPSDDDDDDDDGGHYSVIFPVPRLSHAAPMFKVFSSADQSWSTKFPSISPETTFHDAEVHHPDKAIAVGPGSLAWVDPWKGVLVCDGLDEDKPLLRLIDWPVPLPCRSDGLHFLYSLPDARWDATLSDGTIRFVKAKFHYSGCRQCAAPIGWTATMWKRRCSLKDEWEMCYEVDIAKILTNQSSSSGLLRKVWDAKSNKLDLNKVTSAVPILGLTNEDRVYFAINLYSNKEAALLIAVNVRKKKLEAVERASFERLCSPCSFSGLLDASSFSGLLDASSVEAKVVAADCSI